jgi:mannose-1-phosphate guanylyltransferase
MANLLAPTAQAKDNDEPMPTAMILAAGLGTRLSPLTDELPKPLVPVGDRPMLAHVAAELARAGIGRVALNVFHRPWAFTRTVLDALPVELTMLREDVLLGTAGGLANAAKFLGNGDVVVWNGDILASIDVRALLAAHASTHSHATLVVRPRPRGQGTIGRALDGSIVRLRSEMFGDEVQGGDFLGVQVVGPAVRECLPEQGCLVGDVYLPELRRGDRLGSFEVYGEWTDVGSLAGYLEANLRWLASMGLDNWTGAGAQVAPAIDLRRSVVGAGAIVDGEGTLEECVVWPGAHARAPLRRAIVMSSGQIVPVVV